jgi:hypothetical protein
MLSLPPTGYVRRCWRSINPTLSQLLVVSPNEKRAWGYQETDMSGADESNHESEPDRGAAAAELARRLLLTSAELPGFDAYSAEFNFVSDAVAARCAGVSYEPVARAHSDSYSGRDPSGTALSVVCSVVVLPNTESAERMLTSYRSTRTLECIRAAAAEEFTKAAVQAAVSVALIPDIGRGAVGTHGTVEREAAPGHIQFNDSLIFARGPALVSIGVRSMTSPPSVSFEQRVVDQLVLRAERATPYRVVGCNGRRQPPSLVRSTSDSRR